MSWMQTYNLSVETQCVKWSNIQLPHPNQLLKSSVFHFDGFKWYFEVLGFWRPKIYSSENCEEVWQFSIKSSDHSNSSNSYIIIPYIRTENKYVRIASTILNTDIWRSSLSSIIGSDVNEVTMLFFFSLETLKVEKPIIKFNKTTETSDKEFESMECLSGDISQVLSQKEHADATLKCGDKSFSVHRNILAARSSVFSSMFEHNMSEKNTGIVDIVDLNPDTLEHFLFYLYSGKIEQMCMDTALELYKAARKYAVNSLRDLCVSYILNNMAEDIVCKVLLLADQSEDEVFLDSIASFAADRHYFFLLSEWKEFVSKFPAVAVKVYAKYHDINVVPKNLHIFQTLDQ